MKTRMRILFVAEAVTLAHVARTYALARLLDPARYDVTLACDPRYQFLFEGSEPSMDGALKRVDIHSIPTPRFVDALKRGAPVYQFDTLLGYAQEDRRVIETVDPDVVIGDFRLSLSASARLAAKPYVNVTNAGWSPYARTRFVIPDIDLTRVVGRRIGQVLFDVARPMSFALHAAPLNRLRRHVGLAPLPRDLRYTYTDGDCTLYADLPELFPLDDAPASHAFVGPISWSPRLHEPAWADRIAKDKPVVYVALGSSGRHDLLPMIVEAVAGLPCQVVVATASNAALVDRPNVFASEFLDGDVWASRAAVVVCNGGSPTSYQALARGTPVLGIPSNLDQYLNMTAVASSGAGLLLRSGDVAKAAVRGAVERLLNDPSHVTRAKALAGAMAAFDTRAVLAATCDRLATVH